MVFCVVLSFASFFLGQAILSSGGAPTATLASPGAARAVILTGLFIGLIALMSFGFGLIFRSTAAAIAAFVGVIFVLPLVMHGISESGCPLPADQHPDQLDHVDREPDAGRALPSAHSGRRACC